MNIYTSTPIKVLGFFLILSMLFSCSKDSDLLVDYVLEDSLTPIEELESNSNSTEESEVTVDSINGIIETDEDKIAIFSIFDISNSTSGKTTVLKNIVQPINGEIIIEKDSIIKYMPENDFNGTDTFSYTLEVVNEDNTISQQDNIIEIEVSPVADVVDDVVTITTQTETPISVLQNDTFSDSESVVITNTSNPSKGSIVISSGQTITYMPNSNVTGQDSFTYTTEIDHSDGSVSTEIGNVTVNINISSNEDPPQGQESIIWNTPFESTEEWSPSGNPNNNIWETNGAYTALVGNAREGSGAISLVQQPDDKRNEITTDRLWEDVFGGEFWYGFSFKVVVPVPSGRMFHQLRQIAGPEETVNVLSFRMTSVGNWGIYHATNEALYDEPPIPWGGAGTGARSTASTYTLNQWHDIVVYLKVNSPGNNSDGILKVWQDGELVVNKVNTTVHYRRTLEDNIVQNAMHPKLGPYVGSKARVGEIHYDTFKSWHGAGGTYEDVSPLGLSPNN